MGPTGAGADVADKRHSAEAERSRIRPVRAEVAVRLLFYGPLCLIVVLMTQDLPREAVGGLGLALMLVLMLMKIPVAVAMLSGGALGIWILGGGTVLISTFRTVPFQTVAGWSLSVVPMFILMGLLVWRSGASERIYAASRHWIGWMPGGLAVSTSLAGAGLSAISGSTLAVTYALGRVGIPEMLRAGYDRRYAVAAVLMAGTGGALIPPSVLLVIYAGIASVPVGPQLIAGLVPGIVLALACALVLLLIAVVAPSLSGGRRTRRSRLPAKAAWQARFASLANVWPLPVLGVGMLVGLYTGVFTATEAGAFGAAGALLTALWFRRRNQPMSAVLQAVGDTVKSSGSIFLLVIAAAVLSRFLTLSGLASWLVTVVSDLELSRYQFLFALLFVYLILGMFVDSLTMMLVTVPILMPILADLDISLIWFGVFVVLLGELAIITPPVGVLAFVLHKLAQSSEVNLGQRIALKDVFVGVAWVLPVSIVVLALLIFFPEVAEIVPSTSRN